MNGLKTSIKALRQSSYLLSKSCIFKPCDREKINVMKKYILLILCVGVVVSAYTQAKKNESGSVPRSDRMQVRTVESVDSQRVCERWKAPSLTRPIAPGVVFKRLIFSEKEGNPIFGSNQYVNIIEVDPSVNPNLKFAVSFPGNGPTSLTTKAATDRNALAAINGTMGSWITADRVDYLRNAAFKGVAPLPSWTASVVTGNNCLDYIRGYNTAGTELRFEVPNFAGKKFISGSEVTRSDRRTGVVKIDDTGKLTLECTFGKDINYEYGLDRDKYKYVMASGPMLVDKGVVWNMASNDLNDRRHPRSALAVMPDGKVLMVAVDGRRAAKGAAGMTLRTELSRFLAWIGCEYAINLDGGGSTTIYARDNVSDLADPLDNGILNHPTDNTERDKDGNLTFDNKGERSQGGGFILLLDEKSTSLE